MDVKAPRGTNDILPPVSLKWQYIEDTARRIFQMYNYKEIRTPIFEYTELFQRGIGETTDIVEKEMYTFEDKGGRSITLRPEGTASVVRAFLEHKIYGQVQPTKYFYIGPMFRYERPQAGRFRQFHQLGVEAFGSNDPALDAEVIALGLDILKRLGLTDVEVFINSIGCPECRARYSDELKQYLESHQDRLCKDCKARLNKNPLRILDCKNEECSLVIKNAPKILDYLCDNCRVHFEDVQEYLDLLGIKYRVDPTLVRGLDYYTNTAFEIKFKELGAQDAIFGGGRYNGLTEEIGNKSIPGIGFAVGIERLILALDKKGIKLPVNDSIDVYLVTIGERAKRAAFNYTYLLRESGITAEIDYLGRSIKSQMKSADRTGASYTIIIGDSELDSGKATVKNMRTGEQVEIMLANLIEEMQKLV
ncbi:histidine--tRNA ligase [Halothermothrix orenii]|uniref:Histidine--tRNA ligase n=1 Tax=Halothermothrix orenii (strain H 168 / OCM 544 / DSM 9562) TaxID=373903 RepID=SYH_HALOH|nr:histidine--tRNA ligase [Halothermothrix orenii]B8CXE6.1 RecName: Full=Histidine--tRNA ligase; AltName: Full=Histidyl-tRNA synthetase; Short=HisRS [Halothermothrix orenii H 168]ACL69965.1 histidyl-tRNA synthetase [Halothermothrix orenii H 168]